MLIALWCILIKPAFTSNIWHYTGPLSTTDRVESFAIMQSNKSATTHKFSRQVHVANRNRRSQHKILSPNFDRCGPGVFGWRLYSRCVASWSTTFMKISKIGVTKCQILTHWSPPSLKRDTYFDGKSRNNLGTNGLRLKCAKLAFRRGSVLNPDEESLRHSQKAQTIYCI